MLQTIEALVCPPCAHLGYRLVPGYLRTLLFGWKRLRIQLYFGGSAEQDLLEGVERARLADHRVKYPADECDIGDGSPPGLVDHFDEPVKRVSPCKLTETVVEFFDLRLEVGDVLLVHTSSLS
jgi:hypothetical protein